MYDTTKNTGQLPAQYVSHRSSEPCNVFAVLPAKATKPLIQDTVYVENPESVWPHRSLENRRVYQNLFDRYYRQILYGCKNTACKTSTCLSYQRRVSRRPFRRFGVLSARTLAAFLATQDHPERGLCPHQPVIPRKEPKKDRNENKDLDRILSSRPEKSDPRDRRDSAAFQCAHKACPNKHNDNAQAHDAERTREETRPNLIADGNKQVERRANVNSNQQGIFALEKDPKSFTQNLFSTIAMRWLQTVKIPEGYLQWIPWLDSQVENPSYVLQGGESGTRREKPASDDPHKLHQEKPEKHSFVQPGQQTRRTDTFLSSIIGHESDMSNGSLEARQPVYELSEITSRNGDANAQISLISSGSKQITNRDAPERGAQAGPIQNAVPNMTGDTRTARSCVGVFGNDVSVSKDMPKHLVDIRCLTIPRTSSGHLIRPPQALARFTLENIKALVAVIWAGSPRFHDEYHFLRFMGRTAPQVRISSFVSGTTTQHEMTIAFGIQSIISVLGRAEALQRSFIASPEVDVPNLKCSVEFAEMVQAFRLLMKIDHHPRQIFPSLWVSCGKIYLPKFIRSRNSPLKGCKSFGSDCTLSNNTLIESSMNEDVLGDVEAAHIAKIVFSALVASAPQCSPEIWSEFRSLRAHGRIVPDLSRHDQTSRHLHVKLLDSFEDEMALGLMKRLIKAIAARRCVSEMSRHQDLAFTNGEKCAPNTIDFLNILINELFDSSITNSITKSSDSGEAPVKAVDVSDLRRSTDWHEFSERSFHVAVLVEWLRSVIIKEWDGRAVVSRWGTVGGALEFMSHLFELSGPLGMHPDMFWTPFLSERLDVMDMPTEWFPSQRDRNTLHLLMYPFLFLPSFLVSYFRAINHAAMFKAFESSAIITRLVAHMTFVDPVTGRGKLRLHDRLRTAMSNYLVLEIRRKDVLADAMDQLWRRERRELMRPLKVRMGINEGEEGVDHGGVQQEFFRIAIGEAMRPEYGLFTIDPHTQAAWFQPCSLEPLYKFELLGLLTSLAIYNGITLPVTFPIALYRKLLGLPVTRLEHIKDGWPSLVKGLQELLDWTGADVQDIFLRSYVFSVEAPGKTIYIDMDKVGRSDDWPTPLPGPDESGEVYNQAKLAHELRSSISAQSSPSAPPQFPSSSAAGWITVEHPKSPLSPFQPNQSSHRRNNSITSQACMVTNANRKTYVEDYIFWLTDKSMQPQYEAFARGFYVCLDRTAITIFSPEALKLVVEGTQRIDVNALEETARYEGGYYRDHRVIRDFWHVVRGFSPEALGRLLEFVTASDRIPVNGVRSILFVIQRNGLGDERLPTSLTCFGRLLLPAYSSREKMETMLYTAIENSKGFGTA